MFVDPPRANVTKATIHQRLRDEHGVTGSVEFRLARRGRGLPGMAEAGHSHVGMEPDQARACIEHQAAGSGPASDAMTTRSPGQSARGRSG
jgi:hypothetical protein